MTIEPTHIPTQELNQAGADTATMIDATDLTVRFSMSYDKAWTVREQFFRLLKAKKTKSEERQFYALRDVNFKAYRGDVVGVIGGNGSGKTTFLRTVSGVYTPDLGSVETHGRLSTLLSLGVGFNRDLSGRINLRMSALLSLVPPEDVAERIDEVADFTELGEFLDVPMKYYSNGMISRLNFATLLLIEPEIILIDEILAVGDLAFNKKSRDAMETMLDKAKCQLLVTHSLRLVRERCNRAVLFDRGTIIAEGKPNEIVDMYEAQHSPSNTGGDTATGR